MNRWNPFNDELTHHGVENQRWGVRRYQNADGSLTELGRVHYGVGGDRWSGRNDADTNAIRKDVTTRQTNAIAGAQAITNAASTGINQLNPNSYPINYKKYKDVVDKMDDGELREKINRMNLENQYIRLTDERARYNVNVGHAALSDILSTAATAVGITAGAFTIYKAIKG